MIETRQLFRKAYQIVLEEVEKVKHESETDHGGWLPGLKKLFGGSTNDDIKNLKSRIQSSLEPLHNEWVSSHPIPQVPRDNLGFVIRVQRPDATMAGYFATSYNEKKANTRAELSVLLNKELFAAAVGDRNFSPKSFSHSVARSFTHEEIHLAQASVIAQKVHADKKKRYEFFKEWSHSEVLLDGINGMDDVSRNQLIYLAKDLEIEAYADNAAVHILFLLYNQHDVPLDAAMKILTGDMTEFEELAKRSQSLAGYYLAKKKYPVQFDPAYTSFMTQLKEKLEHHGERYGKAFKRTRKKNVANPAIPVIFNAVTEPGVILNESEF
jgi:hypothetical protein